MSSRAFLVAVRTAALRVVADRGGLVVSIGFYALIVATLSGLWRVAADANAGSIGAYSALAITWYIITSEVAIVSIDTRLIELIGDDIAHGTVATEMLRPASVLGVRVATELGRALPRVVLLWTAGAAIATITAGGPPKTSALLLAAPSLVLAIIANLLAQHAVAAAAFWLRDAGSVWFLYQKLVFIAGGMIIPLELLPSVLERAALLLPFRAMAYAPARLAAGFNEPHLLLEQLAWIAVLAVVASAAFRAGERRLQVVGG